MDLTEYKYYTRLFKDYDDVVDLITFREMLGGISEQAALRLMREKRVKHFVIGNAYKIPKLYVIEYVMSPHYAEYKFRLSVQI